MYGKYNIKCVALHDLLPFGRVSPTRYFPVQCFNVSQRSCNMLEDEII